jgi:hypothetical protein
VRALSKRFSRAERRGPMVVPNLRVTVDELVQKRPLAIEHVAVNGLLAAPPPLPDP